MVIGTTRLTLIIIFIIMVSLLKQLKHNNSVIMLKRVIIKKNCFYANILYIRYASQQKNYVGHRCPRRSCSCCRFVRIVCAFACTRRVLPRRRWSSQVRRAQKANSAWPPVPESVHDDWSVARVIHLSYGICILYEDTCVCVYVERNFSPYNIVSRCTYNGVVEINIQPGFYPRE